MTRLVQWLLVQPKALVGVIGIALALLYEVKQGSKNAITYELTQEGPLKQIS